MPSCGEHDAPIEMFSITPSVMEILIQIVDEILARFPSSKEFSASMGFLKQSICFKGKKSFDSMVYCSVVREIDLTLVGMKDDL